MYIRNPWQATNKTRANPVKLIPHPSQPFSLEKVILKKQNNSKHNANCFCPSLKGVPQTTTCGPLSQNFLD